MVVTGLLLGPPLLPPVPPEPLELLEPPELTDPGVSPLVPAVFALAADEPVAPPQETSPMASTRVSIIEATPRSTTTVLILSRRRRERVSMVIRHMAANVALHNTAIRCGGKSRRDGGSLSSDVVGADITVTVRVEVKALPADGVIEEGLKTHLIHAG